jgi:hypothetical protein
MGPRVERGLHDPMDRNHEGDESRDSGDESPLRIPSIHASSI